MTVDTPKMDLNKRNLRKSERVSAILEDLQRLYPEPPIPLDHFDDYSLLIAVLLSAQCTDERVNQITPALWALADTPHEMVTHDIETIRDIIKPCGLSPQKSKAIWNLSKILIDQYDGKVPNTLEALEALPGVGHKTASVVMSQAFGEPMFPVDTHIHRLAQRWGLSNGKSVTQTEKDLKRLFPKDSWNNLHLQMIFYGREYCQARACYGLTCPICTRCYPCRKKPVVTIKA